MVLSLQQQVVVVVKGILEEQVVQEVLEEVAVEMVVVLVQVQQDKEVMEEPEGQVPAAKAVLEEENLE